MLPVISHDDKREKGPGGVRAPGTCSGHLAISAFTALQPILEMQEMKQVDVQAEWLRSSMALLRGFGFTNLAN